MGLSLHPEHGHCLRIYEVFLRVTRAHAYTLRDRNISGRACTSIRTHTHPHIYARTLGRVYRVILVESNKKHPRASWDGGVRSPFGKWRDPLVQLNLPDNGHQLSAPRTLRKFLPSVPYRFKRRNAERRSGTCQLKGERARMVAEWTARFYTIFSGLGCDDETSPVC